MRPGPGPLDRELGGDAEADAEDPDPVALALLQRYPLPSSSAIANNYNRTDTEVDNQDQWDVRIDHKVASNRDQVFGRLSYFRDRFIPVTPLPDGSGVTSGA